MNQFYLTLPSDSSSKYFPENTTASFKTKLSERISLDGEYEVGLSQVVYPHSWHNFKNQDKSMFTRYIPDNETEERVCVFTSAQFAEEKTMANVLTDWIDLADVTLLWDGWQRKLKWIISQDNGDFYMSDALADYLGFTNPGPYRFGKWTAERPFDIHKNMRLIYIYSNIVSYSLVGDTKTPLLRVLDVQGSYGQTISASFTHPHYVQLAQTDFDSLDVYLRTELGLPVAFEFGKAVITLHFRRKNKLLL